MTKFIQSLQKAFERAKEDYARQWELFPGFDEESKAGRMRLALQLVDAEYDLKNAQDKQRQIERDNQWQHKRATILAQFEAYVAN